MAKNKYDFIKELLEDKKIKQNQRERILKLASKEISNDGTLEERVQEIEKIIFNANSEPKNQELAKPVSSKLPKYIQPYNLYKFLIEYNQNKILKSTCHDLDSDGIAAINEYCKTETYDFQKHLQKVKEAYDMHEKEYFAPPQLKALIRGYLTGKDYKGNQLKRGWSSDNITIHWSTPDLLTWTKEKPGIPPNLNEELLGNKEMLGFEFEQIKSNILGKTIQNFTQLVLHFKHLFHVRDDNSLKEIIEKKNIRENWNDIFDFEITDTGFPRRIEHFTDIDKMVQAYKKIVELIREQHDEESKPKIRLTLSENIIHVRLSIHHLNSIYKKTIQNTIERTGQSYTSLIENQINGLCNLYLRADFGNAEFAEINLWDGNKRQAKKVEHFQGVEHILEFSKI